MIYPIKTSALMPDRTPFFFFSRRTLSQCCFSSFKILYAIYTTIWTLLIFHLSATNLFFLQLNHCWSPGDRRIRWMIRKLERRPRFPDRGLLCHLNGIYGTLCFPFSIVLIANPCDSLVQSCLSRPWKDMLIDNISN
jgi:hypothetical protein